CSTTPPPAPTYSVDAHGSTFQEARQRALRKAEARCTGHEPVITRQLRQPPPPAFVTDPTPSSPPPGEVTDLAATSHEGESPAVRLGFRCLSSPAPRS
ncbi:MAG: hypothetical protein UMU75_12390, partial [Halomonas sp.]|nr:hypothetical protein [Halomonas sp.]